MPSQRRSARRDPSREDDARNVSGPLSNFDPRGGPSYTPQERTDEEMGSDSVSGRPTSFNPEDGPSYTPQARDEPWETGSDERKAKPRGQGERKR